VKILLDTNFLLIPFENNVDIFMEFARIMDGPYELFILSSTLDEIKKVRFRLFNAINELVSKKGVRIIPAKMSDVDREILSLSGYIIATNDKILKQKLKKKGKKVIILRQRSHLDFA